MVLACFSNAVAQVSYKVTDLGVLHKGYFGCAMGLNNHGWTETQYGELGPSGNLVKGRVAINVDGLTIDLGTLGGPDSWDNPYGGEINDRGEAVGYSETSVPDPDGEDICGFGTGLTCRPFLWRSGHMKALPTLGGNNGWASAINNRGQIAGFAELLPWTLDARLIGSNCRCCGKKAKLNLFPRWVVIQTGTHTASMIKAKP